MNEEAALLRAICEHPDEDTPRLMFADWLSEQGGPLNIAWASGIRAQIGQSRGDNADTRKRTRSLLETGFGLERLHERFSAPDGLFRDWERGFPTFITARFDSIRELWPKLAFRVPIRKLHIYDVPSSGAAEFVTWSGLTVLRELIFATAWGLSSPVDALPLLAECAGLRSLVSLDAQNVLVTEAGVTAILDSQHLTNLQTCRLQYVHMPNAVSTATRTRFGNRFGPTSLFDIDPIPF